MYGQKKFEDIQDKDLRKQVELQEKGFNLIIIDISKKTYWKTTQPFLKDYYIKYIKSLILRSG